MSYRPEAASKANDHAALFSNIYFLAVKDQTKKIIMHYTIMPIESVRLTAGMLARATGALGTEPVPQVRL